VADRVIRERPSIDDYLPICLQFVRFLTDSCL